MNTISSTPSDMNDGLRVCILTSADSLSWTQHYVDAFRQRAEVITVGPGLDPKQLEDWDLDPVTHALTPTNVEVELHPDLEISSILPQGWSPDLIVSIANPGVILRPTMFGMSCPTAYITVDTWQKLSDYVEAQQYDFVFPVQKAYVPLLESTGSANVSWVPLGCNPDAHFPVDAEPDHDVSFVGNIILPFHQARYDLLEQLEQRFSVYIRSKVFREDLCRATAHGRLAFNRSAIDDVNMRVFEIMAMGRPLLTNSDADKNGLSDLFEDGKHLIRYDGAHDIIGKVEHCLANPAEREAIANAGMTLVRSKHRYVDRVDEMLSTIQTSVPGWKNRGKRAVYRVDDAMANLVPFGAAFAVDVGGRLQPHQAILHERGVERIESGSAATGMTETAYVVAADSSIQLGADCLGALERAYALLVPGGTLLLRLTASDFSTATGITSLNDLELVFANHGFHVTHCEIEGTSDVLVRARKRTRPLLDIVQESCERFPHLDADGLTRWARAFGPNY